MSRKLSAREQAHHRLSTISSTMPINSLAQSGGLLIIMYAALFVVYLVIAWLQGIIQP